MYDHEYEKKKESARRAIRELKDFLDVPREVIQTLTLDGASALLRDKPSNIDTISEDWIGMKEHVKREIINTKITATSQRSLSNLILELDKQGAFDKASGV